MPGEKTKMWCPACRSIEPCEAVRPKGIGADDLVQRRIFSKNERPINAFRRIRQCKGCSQEFFTCEVDEHAIDELLSLRKLVVKLRSIADRQAEDMKAVAENLKSQTLQAVEEVEADNKSRDDLYPFLLRDSLGIGRR